MKKLKGYLRFVYADNTMKYCIEEHDLEVNIIGDLMSGQQFYEHVDSFCITDEDGILGDVYVDGYKSNLGLIYAGLSQGDFMVDEEMWLELCDEFDIEVEWCNK